MKAVEMTRGLYYRLVPSKAPPLRIIGRKNADTLFVRFHGFPDHRFEISHDAEVALEPNAPDAAGNQTT